MWYQQQALLRVTFLIVFPLNHLDALRYETETRHFLHRANIKNIVLRLLYVCKIHFKQDELGSLILTHSITIFHWRTIRGTILHNVIRLTEYTIFILVVFTVEIQSRLSVFERLCRLKQKRREKYEYIKPQNGVLKFKLKKQLSPCFVFKQN